MNTSWKSGYTPTIREFYAGRSIFITGGTGFLGKVLIEKILRSCPEVRELFVLMRPKKNKSIDERLKYMLDLPLFDRIKKERPKFAEKIIPINGDVAVEGLGIGPVERQFIQERVSIVFHVAANVRFDDSLKQAVFVNTRSTRDVCILAQGMKKLVALVHVSSTYAHADKPEVEEIVYPPYGDWRKTIKIAENLDDSLLRPMTPKYLGCMPNTYTFTKRLAEQVIVDFSKDLPTVICRPSIVITSSKEPMPGWVDNFNGPVGLVVGGGKGLLRICLADPDIAPDFIPVDVTILVMLISAYRRGLETVTENPEPLVVNAASQSITTMTTGEVVRFAIEITKHEPLVGALWYPQVTLTPNYLIYYVLSFLLHVIPAYILDRLLQLNGKKPMVMKLQRRIYVSNCTLGIFVLKAWKFHTDRCLKLLDDIPPPDLEAFHFDAINFDPYQYLRESLSGGKKYLLHEDERHSEQAIRHFYRMWLLDRVCKGFFLAILTWILYKYEVFALLGFHQLAHSLIY